MDFQEFLNKKIKIVINEGSTFSCYVGFIQRIEEPFLVFRDKFNQEKIFGFNSIAKIELVNNHD